MPFPSDSELGSPSRLLAIAIFLALVVATLTAVVRDRPTGGRILHDDYLTREGSTDSGEPETLALAWIDAVPWGRIERIASPTGELYEPPSPAETPVMLELPAGDWIVTLSNPDAEEERRCELSLAFDSPGSCRVEFEALSVDDYFREAGWWR